MKEQYRKKNLSAIKDKTGNFFKNILNLRNFFIEYWLLSGVRGEGCEGEQGEDRRREQAAQGEARQGGGRAQEKATGKDATECRRCSRSSSTRRRQSSRESFR